MREQTLQQSILLHRQQQLTRQQQMHGLEARTLAPNPERHYFANGALMVDVRLARPGIQFPTTVDPSPNGAGALRLWSLTDDDRRDLDNIANAAVNGTPDERRAADDRFRFELWKLQNMQQQIHTSQAQLQLQLLAVQEVEAAITLAMYDALLRRAREGRD